MRSPTRSTTAAPPWLQPSKHCAEHASDAAERGRRLRRRHKHAFSEGGIHILRQRDELAVLGKPANIAVVVVVTLSSCRDDVSFAFHDHRISFSDEAGRRVSIFRRELREQRPEKISANGILVLPRPCPGPLSAD